MKERRQNQCFRGFTLVELLVVISVIALLMAIMMPILNKVRENARRTVCMSNLRQLAVASTAYATDYNLLPFNGSRYDGLENYVLFCKRDKQWWNHGLLYSLNYLSEPKCFYCPSDKKHNYDEYWDGGKPKDTFAYGDVYIRCSYLARDYNPKVKKTMRDSRDRFDYRAWKKLASRMPFGEKFAFLADRWTYSTGAVHEGKYYNTMYADGHVGTVKDPQGIIAILGNVSNPELKRHLPAEYADWEWNDAWKLFDLSY